MDACIVVIGFRNTGSDEVGSITLTAIGIAEFFFILL